MEKAALTLPRFRAFGVFKNLNSICKPKQPEGPSGSCRKALKEETQRAPSRRVRRAQRQRDPLQSAAGWPRPADKQQDARHAGRAGLCRKRGHHGVTRARNVPDQNRHRTVGDSGGKHNPGFSHTTQLPVIVVRAPATDPEPDSGVIYSSLGIIPFTDWSYLVTAEFGPGLLIGTFVLFF